MANSTVVKERISGGSCEICGWQEWNVRKIESTGERYAECRNCGDDHPEEYADV